MSTTVSLLAAAAVDEGGTITYTADVGAIPVSSDVTVSLDNGQTITILAGQTSGAVTVLVPADVYAASPGAQVAAIAGVAGTGGFDSLVFDPAPVSTAVNQVTDVTTLSLSATAVAAEGGSITYTASVGANPALSDVMVALNNGHTITIAAGQTSGTVTVPVPPDVTAATPGGQAAAIASVTGDGGFESLEFNPAQVSTAILSSAVLAVDEADAPITSGGQLTITDTGSPATFVAQTDTAGAHGSFSIDTTGAWTYTANSAFDSLNVGDSVSDTFIVASADGTTTTVQVTINGSNDAAVLSSATLALDETNAPLATAGALTISDVDSPATFVAQTDTAGTYGSFSIDTTGAWTYTANSAFDSLNVGDSVSDTFTVASADGTTTTVQVTINGSNDAAVLSSATLALDETNAPLATAGALTISDVDSPATFVAQTDTAGTYGSFSIDTTGAWTYTANSAFDSLNVGDSVSDTFTVASADGTTTTVQVTINGSNDAAVLSSATLALDETNAPLATAGTLTISDVDSPATFVAQTDTAGTYGSFSIDTAGAWTYTANSAFDSLNVGDSVSDTFTVASADGTTTTVQVTINGSNDAAVLSSATLALDETNAPLATAGALTISDVDSPATFVAQTDTAGTYGSFSIDTAGAWTYTANSAFDSLNVGDSVSDTFTVASADGTTTTVQVTINGSNDAAVLSSATLALDETNAPLATAGALTISDVDSPATFVAQTDTAGTYGSFSIDTAGAWTYTANSAFDSLNVGDSVSDTFTVASADGTTSTVQVTINGSNDAAVLSSATLALDEIDAPLATAGTLTISDVDSPATFVAQTDTAGTYGSFSIDTAGAWTYTANSAFDSLNVGDSVSDTFTVASADGTTTTVQVTINGSNDAAVLSSATLALDETNAPLATAGALTISDVDSPATFVAQTDTAGAHGSFSIDTAGAWTYTANSAFDSLNVGDSVSDTFTVASADGTTTTVQVTINGANDAATIIGTSTGAVIEATNLLPGTPSASGTLTDSDVDNAANTFTAVAAPAASAGGFGSFTMTAGGVWTYTLDNANPTVQALNAGQTLTDTFTVRSVDGTAQVVTVTINGATDAYNLTDTAANLANPLITPVALANGATNITATTPATVAQAVAIDAFTNSGVNSYSISDNAFFVANLANPAVTPPSVGQNATNITVTTDATEGQAQAISLLVPHGTLTYNLADQVQVLTAQTPAAIRAANHATNITVTASPSTGLLVTLAQATIIDGFTNTGTNSYQLQDSAANLLAALPSVISGASGVFATGLVSVAQAAALVPLNVHLQVETLFDTAANLAAATPAVGSNAIQITAATPATVAQAAVIQSFVNPGLHTYSLSDTAAALTAAPALVANGAQDITVSGVATVAQATIIDAFTNGGSNSYVLTDTAANLALASVSVGSGAIVINASTAATVAQASVFTAFNDPQVTGGGVKNYSLSDTAANLALASALVGNGAANISATTPATVAQATVIDAFTNTGVNSYVLADTAANLAAATALVGHNATNIVATTAATVAQANAIDAFTNSGSNSFSLADTAANLAAALPAVANQAINITTTNGATVAQANTIDAFLNTGVNSYSLADSSVNLLAPAAAARVSAATAVTVTNAIPVANAVSLRALNANTVYNLSDTAANLAAAGPAVGNAASSITVTTAASVAQAVTIEGYTNAGALSFNLSDSTANLIAAPAALTIGANTISISSVDALTVAGAAGKAAGTYALQDTAAALAGASAAVGNGATLINATTAVTAAQIDAIHAIVKPGVHTLLALSDTAANLAAKIGLADVALADARSFNVTTAATVAQAHAIHGYNAISAKVGYAVSDTAANLAGAITLVGGADPALASATSFTVTGAATVAQANAIHGYNAVSSLSTYLLADTGAALMAAPAATVHSASDLTVTDTLLATQAATLSTELGVPADPAHFHYTLSDTATNLAALPAALVSGHPVTVVGPASVAEAAILHTEAPAATYSIVDTATTLASALTTGSISLAAVKFAGTIDVDGPAINASLTVNADQFHNMLVAGHPLLALNDTIALDGDVAANLGTLTDFGGNDAAGIVLGGGLNGAYTVNLGTSGDATVTMAGTGHHDITAATGTKETFVVGLISTGGSTLRNLESGEVIDTTTGNFGQGTKNNPSTQVATGALVTGPSQWAYEAANHTLTWWDPTHGTPETLVLHFASVGDVGGVQVKSTHSFTVI